MNKNTRYHRANQRRSYSAGFQLGFGYADKPTRKPAGLNSRIYKIGIKEGKESRIQDEKNWDFLK